MPSPVLPTAKLNAFRSALIAVGLALLLWVQPDVHSGQRSIIIGVAMQLFWWLALWCAHRYEQVNQLEGTLQPIVKFVLELLFDAVTMTLFAHAVLQHWWQAGQAL